MAHYGTDVEDVDRALAEQSLALAPVSMAELLSDPDLPGDTAALVLALPQLEITAGYWERAGKLRREILIRRHRAKIADTLIAQSCLDRQVPLVTRDRDFLSFQKCAGLKLL